LFLFFSLFLRVSYQNDKIQESGRLFFLNSRGIIGFKCGARRSEA
jgi:hypothetical protein